MQLPRTPFLANFRIADQLPGGNLPHFSDRQSRSRMRDRQPFEATSTMFLLVPYR